jgi:2-polyprenyl-3-methyl-5-hydroxy-6-metoxy-1,4-benzoquinol methylase
MKLNKYSINEFVEKSDSLGGPNTPLCNDYWNGLSYEPTCSLNAQDDPLSNTYLNQQMVLYEEITGHKYLDVRDEFTPSVVASSLLNAPNAYNHPDPSEYAKHCIAISLLVQKLKLPRGARILELGSGWGFCQEFLSQCGFETVGIDANADFVATSNARLERLGFGTRTIFSTFDELSVSKVGQFDAVIAYEAFHHAVDAFSVLKRAVACLRPSGVFALAAEPFNDFYSTWGLRLDCYSIYCTRKFGWFESGWSVQYMADLFGRCGLEAQFIDAGISEYTKYMIGRFSETRQAFQLGMWHPNAKKDFFINHDHICSKGDSTLKLYIPNGKKEIHINFHNFNVRNLRVSLIHNKRYHTLSVPPGPFTFMLQIDEVSNDLISENIKIESELFCPANEGINADDRNLGIHIHSIKYT